MAEGVFDRKCLEELEEEITCSVCREHYTEPKVLSCLHCYCRECILRLAQGGMNGPFSCPECRCEATLPEGGVDELKTAFFVNRLKTIVSTMQRAQGKVEANCEACSEYKEKAEAFCKQCAMFICSECVKQHKRMKPFVSHEVTSLEDLRDGRTKPMVSKESPIRVCDSHEEPLMIYCFDCVELICLSCTVKDHRDHNFEFSKKAAPNTKITLLEELTPLKDLKLNLSQAVEEIQATKLQVQAQEESLLTTIHASFKELHDILDKREQELLEEAKRRGREKIQKLSSQEKNLSLAKAEVQSVVSFTEQCVHHSSDNDVMSMYAQLENRIKEKIEPTSGKIVEPIEEVDVGVEVTCAEGLQQLCQTQASITQLPIDPAKSTVTIKTDGTAKIILQLITRLSNNTLSKKKCKVTSHIKSLVNGVSTECKIDQIEATRYSTQYKPIVCGQHELTVLVNGQEVAGSPFSLFVSATHKNSPLTARNKSAWCRQNM